MRHWTPLWSPIVDSSIWDEPDFVCKVWITMLALKDSDDVCRLNAYQLAKRARKDEAEVLEALRILSSPDQRRIEPQEHDGRRIRAVPDGWLILNGAKYREMVAEEMQKARWRRAQAKKRAKEKAKKESDQVSSMAGINSMPHPPSDSKYVPHADGPTVDPYYYNGGKTPFPEDKSERPRTTHDPQFDATDNTPEPIEKSAEQFMDENL